MADDDTRWIEVLAKAAALIALKGADIEDEPLPRAQFLMALGLSQPEASKMLGLGKSTLAVAKHRAKTLKGRRNGKSKKSS